MENLIIQCERVGKKFRRADSFSLLPGLVDGLRTFFRAQRSDAAGLRPNEFWALHEVSFTVRRGECLGIIGPNGAGKSTLLKLLNGDYRPDRGQVIRGGAVTSLIRLGNGLQPMLTGRENIFIKCSELGFSKTETDALMGGIVEFSGLAAALDQPVKRYSDGMYARLEFSIATCAPMDILLIDEVLAVGDFAFQMRCLQRLDQLKKAGTAILFVSHSEMNVRHIADRCLLLFDGEPLALGTTDALFRKYYEATGYFDQALEPLGLTPAMPEAFSGSCDLRQLTIEGQSASLEVATAHTGKPLCFRVGYACRVDSVAGPPSLVLQFWSSTGLLIGSYESECGDAAVWQAGGGAAILDLPFLGLSAGLYRVAGGFRSGHEWLSYHPKLLGLLVHQSDISSAQGLVVLHGELSAGLSRPSR